MQIIVRGETISEIIDLKVILKVFFRLGMNNFRCLRSASSAGFIPHSWIYNLGILLMLQKQQQQLRVTQDLLMRLKPQNAPAMITLMIHQSADQNHDFEIIHWFLICKKCKKYPSHFIQRIRWHLQGVIVSKQTRS